MKIDKIEVPIATRSLTYNGGSITVTIGAPALCADGNDYYCAYCIQAQDDAIYSYAFGVDGIQAIQLVLRKVGIDLRFLSETFGTISWLGDELGDTGFPMDHA